MKTIDTGQRGGEVYTGEIGEADSGVILSSGPLGSCVAVLAYDSGTRRGVLAHVMLPGRAPGVDRPFRYADNAIDELVRRFPGTVPHIWLVGGANVLRRLDDSIADHVVTAVRAALARCGWPVCAEVLGGQMRRSARLDTATGECHYTEGDDSVWRLLSGDTRPRA